MRRAFAQKINPEVEEFNPLELNDEVIAKSLKDNTSTYKSPNTKISSNNDVKSEVKSEVNQLSPQEALDQEKSRRISLVRNKMAWEEDEACNLEEYERKKKK